MDANLPPNIGQPPSVGQPPIGKSEPPPVAQRPIPVPRGKRPTGINLANINRANDVAPNVLSHAPKAEDVKHEGTAIKLSTPLANPNITPSPRPGPAVPKGKMKLFQKNFVSEFPGSSNIYDHDYPTFENLRMLNKKIEDRNNAFASGDGESTKRLDNEIEERINELANGSIPEGAAKEFLQVLNSLMAKAEPATTTTTNSPPNNNNNNNNVQERTPPPPPPRVRKAPEPSPLISNPVNRGQASKLTNEQFDQKMTEFTAALKTFDEANSNLLSMNPKDKGYQMAKAKLESASINVGVLQGELTSAALIEEKAWVKNQRITAIQKAVNPGEVSNKSNTAFVGVDVMPHTRIKGAMGGSRVALSEDFQEKLNEFKLLSESPSGLNDIRKLGRLGGELRRMATEAGKSNPAMQHQMNKAIGEVSQAARKMESVFPIDFLMGLQTAKDANIEHEALHSEMTIAKDQYTELMKKLTNGDITPQEMTELGNLDAKITQLASELVPCKAKLDKAIKDLNTIALKEEDPELQAKMTQITIETTKMVPVDIAYVKETRDSQMIHTMKAQAQTILLENLHEQVKGSLTPAQNQVMTAFISNSKKAQEFENLCTDVVKPFGNMGLPGGPRRMPGGTEALIDTFETIWGKESQAYKDYTTIISELTLAQEDVKTAFNFMTAALQQQGTSYEAWATAEFETNPQLQTIQSEAIKDNVIDSAGKVANLKVAMNLGQKIQDPAILYVQRLTRINSLLGDVKGKAVDKLPKGAISEDVGQKLTALLANTNSEVLILNRDRQFGPYLNDPRKMSETNINDLLQDYDNVLRNFEAIDQDRPLPPSLAGLTREDLEASKRRLQESKQDFANVKTLLGGSIPRNEDKPEFLASVNRRIDATNYKLENETDEGIKELLQAELAQLQGLAVPLK